MNYLQYKMFLWISINSNQSLHYVNAFVKNVPNMYTTLLLKILNCVLKAS